MKKQKAGITDPMLAELVTIRRLLVFSLLKSGASQKQVAAALGIDPSQVSRMFPAGIGESTRGGHQG